MRLWLAFVLLLILHSCKTGSPGLFGKSSPHEQYARKLTDAGLNSTALGSLWFSAADKALTAPQSITLPYKQTGYFAPDKPRAVGLLFPAKQGEKIFFRLDKKDVVAFSLYADLWKAETSQKPSRVLFADSTQTSFDYEIDETGNYILRLQPELLRGGEYTISISVGPSLAFPVAGKSGKVGSTWGDDRDGGARRHEGIDIFAPKRTPVVAAGAGTVGRVNETAIGGKVIWMRPAEKNINLYYAHLDEQLVRPGQQVKTGDTLGLVGNTGNARTTPPHLHFGIYGNGGAVDPLPFVNPVIKNPGEISFDKPLNRFYRLVADHKSPSGTIDKNTIGLVRDASSTGVWLQLPAGEIIKAPLSLIQLAENQLFTLKTKDDVPLLDAPLQNAATISYLKSNAAIRVLGYYNGFAYVQVADNYGWIENRNL